MPILSYALLAVPLTRPACLHIILYNSLSCVLDMGLGAQILLKAVAGTENID